MKKPKSIQSNEFKSKKWDDITTGRDFSDSDVPTLELLCNWYAVVEQCISDISTNDGVKVAYSNDMGDIKALPQLSTMKQASAEIRALNKQLGINDEAPAQGDRKAPVLNVIMQNRQSKAKGGNRTKTG